MNIDYIIDEKGKQKAVIIQIDEWNKFKNENLKLKKKLNVLSGIKDAFQEIEEIKQGKRKKGQTLSEFLNEV
ncbi:MAG: hypothetical protein AABZ74_18835 [Cyanobacteriota bacterium]